MDMNSVKINTSRSGFDMSSKLLYSAKTGELLPVFCQEMIPSNKKRISINWFSRTQPVNTAAFTRIREYYDFYFVPYAQLWKQWKMFAIQLDINSIYASDINNAQNVGDVHPYFTFKQVADYIYNLNHYQETDSSHDSSADLNCLGFSRAKLTVKLLQYLGYGDFSLYLDTKYGDPYELEGQQISTHPLNVPLNPWPLLSYQKVYQDKFRNSQWEKSSPQTYNLDYITGIGNEQIPIDDIDMESRISMFDLHYCNWNKDYYMGLQPSSQMGDSAVVPINLTLDHNTQIGKLYGGTGTDSGKSGSASVVFQNNIGVREDGYLFPYNDVNLTSSAGNVSKVLITPDIANRLSESISDLSILLLRQYEMLQRYREVQQSHNTDYKEQIEALFGVSLSWHDSNQVRWLGGVARNFDISEVVNNNITSDNPADIAGKGISLGDGYVDFDAQGEYGILICIYHNMPLLDYSLGAPLKLNTKYKFSDYAQPAFDRIGMAPVYATELFNSTSLAHYFYSSSEPDSDEHFASLVLGYGPRYLDYKTQIDRVVGVFTKDEKSWVAPFSDDFFRSFYLLLQSRYPLSSAIDSTSYFNYAIFKVNPHVLDPIFGVSADDSVSSDQFLCNVSFDVKDVKNLDYDGMPY